MKEQKSKKRIDVWMPNELFERLLMAREKEARKLRNISFPELIRKAIKKVY